MTKLKCISCDYVFDHDEDEGWPDCPGCNRRPCYDPECCGLELEDVFEKVE